MNTGFNNSSVEAGFKKLILVAWIIATGFFLFMGFRYIEMPHNQISANCDEYFYSAPALTLAETGYYANRKTFPAGLYDNGDRYLHHTQLTPFIQAVFIKQFGYGRFAIRIHSLIFFTLSSLVVSLLFWKLDKTNLTIVLGFALFLASPWAIFAGTTARPEMFGAMLLYLSCACLVGIQNKRNFGFLLSGILSGIAAYNHPMFLGVSCLPFLFGLYQYKISLKDRKSVFLSAVCYGGGAILAVSIIMCILILPFRDQWVEQFFLGRTDPNNTLYSQRNENFIQQIVSLKARFSTYGAGYLSWYLAVLLMPIIFRGKIYFHICLAWILLTMYCIHIKTNLTMGYCVQFAIGMPILLLMTEGNRFQFLSKRSIVLGVGVIVFIQSIFHTYSVINPNKWAVEFKGREEIIAKELQSLDSVKRIIGPLEAAMPVLKGGHIYFDPSDFGFRSDTLKKYHRLIREQADYQIDKKLQIKSGTSGKAGGL